MRFRMFSAICTAIAVAVGCGELEQYTSQNPLTGVDGGTGPSCSDKVKNQDEIDIDCGGSCGDNTCAVGQTCGDNADCSSAICQSGKCAASNTCGDGQKNDGESDIDCGGACQNRCGLTKICNHDNDCTSGMCENNQCVAPGMYTFRCQASAGDPCTVKVYHPTLPANTNGNWVQAEEVQMSVDTLCNPGQPMQRQEYGEVVHVYTISQGQFNWSLGEVVFPDGVTTKFFSEAMSPHQGGGTITRVELRCTDFGYIY